VETKSAYAPPSMFGWGAWTDLVRQISGPITYRIAARPMGSLSKVLGEVKYLDERGEERVDYFWTQSSSRPATSRKPCGFGSDRTCGEPKCWSRSCTAAHPRRLNRRRPTRTGRPGEVRRRVGRTPRNIAKEAIRGAGGRMNSEVVAPKAAARPRQHTA
jgi:hypothetical protein